MASDRPKKVVRAIARGTPTTFKRGWTAPGRRPQNLDRRFDQTQLKSTAHGKVVHRDYAAHFFRWGFASNFVKQGKTRILDVGCGQEWPIARTLTHKLADVPKQYLGVDLNRVQKKPGMAWSEVRDEFNFVDRHLELVKEFGKQSFDLATCFEVIEHMHPPDGRKLLMAVADLVKPGGTFLLSTPVFNGKAAANHIHEYTVDELAGMIAKTNKWDLTKRYGTFASWNDLKKVITKAERELYEELHEYYSHEVLSCFLAPKYPDASRNIIWHLTRR